MLTIYAKQALFGKKISKLKLLEKQIKHNDLISRAFTTISKLPQLKEYSSCERKKVKNKTVTSAFAIKIIRLLTISKVST